MGRETAFSRLAQSIVPVGNHTNVRPPGDPTASISRSDPGFEDWIMDIVGTAFQVGDGKLLTCWHVIKELKVQERHAYLQANTRIGDTPAKRYYPILMAFNFIDPRTDALIQPST
jgi:hypothetical protein